MPVGESAFNKANMVLNPMPLCGFSNMISPCDVSQPARADIGKKAGFLGKCPECSPHRLSGTFPAKESGFSNISVLLNANPSAGTVQKTRKGLLLSVCPNITPKSHAGLAKMAKSTLLFASH